MSRRTFVIQLVEQIIENENVRGTHIIADQ